MVTELTPQEVAATLDSEGIKNRVVIVSACYSGIFVPPLANDNTIVLTAADAKNTSFGCAPERDWTYFGDAFFRQSLRPGRDFQRAFDNARVLIQGWELMDRARAVKSARRISGAALVAKLAPLFRPSSGRALEHDPEKRAPDFDRMTGSGCPRFRTLTPRGGDLAPGLERQPQTAVEPEAIDRRRRIDGADAGQAARRVHWKRALLQHAARRRIGDARAGLQRLVPQIAECIVDHARAPLRS